MVRQSYNHIKEDPGTSKVQLVIVTGFLVLAWLFDQVYFIYASAFIGLSSMLIPPLGNGIVWLWYKIAEVLGTLNARIILTVLYYLFVTPIALLFRMSGNDPMALKKPDNTVYVAREKTYQADDLKNPW